jgi:hypothetical protein
MSVANPYGCWVGLYRRLDVAACCRPKLLGTDRCLNRGWAWPDGSSAKFFYW